MAHFHIQNLNFTYATGTVPALRDIDLTVEKGEYVVLCGHSGSVEANGDVYAYDRYAFPAYRLGNILETDLGALMESNRRFGMHKTYGLPQDCFACPYVKLCFGGCPKDRLWGNRNYLCEGYKMFFRHLQDNI